MVKQFAVGCGMLALFGFVLIGCQPSSSGKPQAGKAAAGGGHDHDHDDHGPHGGHLLHLDPDGIHAEWDHDDDKKLITVYLDDFKTAPSEVKFVVKVGDTEPQVFALAKGEGDEGGGAWTLTSDALLTHLAMGEAANVQLVIVHADKQLSTKIQHSSEHHH